MRVFPAPNTVGPACPICNTKALKETVLCRIANTEDEDGVVEAIQVHLDCIELWWHPTMKILFQKMGE